MLRCLLVALLALSVLQSAAAAAADPTESSRSVLLGAPEQILAYHMQMSNGALEFVPTSSSQIPSTLPSWILFREPHHLYAVDEDSANTRLFYYNKTTGYVSPQPVFTGQGGTGGVVHLLFTPDRTRMIGPSYSEGIVDVWDTSSADGKFFLNKHIVLEGPLGPNSGRQEKHHAHESVLDPSGRFFVINDLGGDSLQILSSQNGDVNFQSRVQVQPAGCGPRHGAFITFGGRKTKVVQEEGAAAAGFATHYVVACEMASQLLLFEVAVSTAVVEGREESSLQLTQVQALSTYGEAFPPANPATAAAGELVVSFDQRHVYVSNRQSGNATDSVSHFVLESDGSSSVRLRFADQIATDGILPRGMSLSADAQQTLLLVCNQQGPRGLGAYARDVSSGTVNPAPVGQIPNDQITKQDGNGPQIVIDIN